MIEDFATDETGEVIDADICIIGGGAAGITIAREFADSPLNVCVLEGGGFEYDLTTQSLYSGENSGLPYFPLEACRLRYFGGTTNHWSGQCAPLSDIDFETRPWVAHSGWPISKADLDPFYSRAQSVCELGNYLYDERLFEALEIEEPDLNRDLLRAFFFRYSAPIRFGDTYRAELQRATNIRVLLNANVVNLATGENGDQVEQAEITSLSGKSAQVRARMFVLACGAIENARLLLLSTDSDPNGLGNQNDMVGRFFMEHPEGPSGSVVTQDPMRLLYTFTRHWRGGIQFRPAFRTADDLQRREQVLGASSVLEYTVRADSGTTAAISIGRSLSNGERPDDLAGKIWRILLDLDEVLPNAYRYIVQGKEPIAEPDRLFFKTLAEQAPNPESRVTLSDDEDDLGKRRARLDWRLTDMDKKTIEVITTNLGVEFGRLGFGRVQLDEWLTDTSDTWQTEGGRDLRGGFHHMGTTRMSADPSAGVVDSDCRLHGTPNLYIAGSSVFPTSGHVNPTLTIVALALRTADHLKQSLA